MDSEPFTKECWTCGKKMTFATEFGAMYVLNCTACNLEVYAGEEKQRQERRRSKWHSICPKDFHNTAIEKLPCQEAAKQVMAWGYDRRGLILVGPTGTGKSRCSWMMLEKFHMGGNRIDVLNSLSGIVYAAQFAESSAKVERWMNRMIEADILFMDDIFKNKLTDSFEGAIFSIIDQRTENGRPIIVTANDTGSTLTSRMTNDRGEPMVRRLREFCDAITFSK